MIALWTALALSQPVDDEPFTIVVYDQAALDEARAEVAEDLTDVGWTLVGERGGTLVFKPNRAWLGRATLHADGRLSFGGSPPSDAKLEVSPMGQAPDRPGCASLPDRPIYAIEGDLVTVSGERPTDDLSVTFALYENRDASTPVWRETHVVSVREGRYHALLGLMEPLDTLDWHETQWLGVSTRAISEQGRRRFQHAAHLVRSLTDQGGCGNPSALDPTMPAVSGQPMLGVSFTGPASRRKTWRHHERALVASQDSRAHLRHVLGSLGLQRHIAALPERLDDLWTQGQPLYGTRRLSSPAARRAAVLDYWATRAATVDGVRVCVAIEDWLAAVVAQSDHPLTESEALAAEVRRADGRVLPR